MILQALAGFYDRKLREGSTDIEPAGYKRVAIPFLLVLKKDGTLTDVIDTRSDPKKNASARSFLVPKVFEGSRTVNVKANLLWDKAGYVLGVSAKAKPSRLEQQKASFRQLIINTFPDFHNVEGVGSVVDFLDHHSQEIESFRSWEEISTTDPNLAFQIVGETELVSSKNAVPQVLHSSSASEANRICLVSGRVEPIARLENPLRGLRFSGKAESHLVSFNESAYWSYGKERDGRHFNASIGKYSSFAYVSALNSLQQKDSGQVLWVGDTTTLFWAERKSGIEDIFGRLFGATNDKDDHAATSIQTSKQVLSLFRAPESAAKPELDPNIHFYVLGLAPNVTRVSVRFWYAGTVGEVADHISQHFDDIEIVHPPQQPPYLPLWRLLKTTALLEKSENIAPNMAGACMKAILEGTPYPRTLLSAAITRCRAEREVGYPRASLIKAILVRNARFYRQPEKEVGMGLDIANTNIGYRLGRLFAVLEKAQEEANPGINATIRDRFYGSASGTPVVAFSHLMKLKNHHVAKLENRGRAVNLERLISEIMDGITDFPAHLRLEDQGRFAVGYYHQRQAFFTKAETSSTQQ